MSNGHRTVDRIAAILELAIRSPDGIRLGPVAAELDAPKSSIHGLMRGLLAVGYLVERNGSYVIGPGISKLLAPSHEQSIEEVAHDKLMRLRDQTGETALLGSRIGNSVAYTLQLESPNLVRYAAPLRSRRPLTLTSMGKIFLSHLEGHALNRALRAVAEKEEFDEGRLRAELAEVRERGVSFNVEESVDGVVGVATGLYGVNCTLVAAVSVAGPSERMQPRLEEIVDFVRATGREISRHLGAERSTA